MYQISHSVIESIWKVLSETELIFSSELKISSVSERTFQIDKKIYALL